MNMMRRTSMMLALVAAAALAGCGGGPRFWGAAPVNVGGIQIHLDEARSKGDKLQVRTTFFNQSAMPLVVNRDAVVAVLPNGQTVGRFAGGGLGGLGGLTHIPYTIPPGGSHQVYVDFIYGGHWHEFPNVQVNWSNAVTVNGAPVALPPTVLAQAR